MYSRRAAKLSAHDGDEGIRARPIAATFCSEAAKSLLKKLLDDLEVRWDHLESVVCMYHCESAFIALTDCPVVNENSAYMHNL